MQPSDRFIFRYRDDQGDRFGDPLAIAYRFFKGCESLDSDMESLFKNLAHEDILVAGEMQEKLAPIIAAAFEVDPFDSHTGRGLSWPELLDLLDTFFEWQEKKSSDTGNSPSTSAPIPGSDPPAPGGSSPPTITNSPLHQNPAQPPRPGPQAVPVGPNWGPQGATSPTRNDTAST